MTCVNCGINHAPRQTCSDAKQEVRKSLISQANIEAATERLEAIVNAQPKKAGRPKKHG